MRVGVHVPEQQRPVRPGQLGEQRIRVVERDRDAADERRQLAASAERAPVGKGARDRVDKEDQSPLEAQTADGHLETDLDDLVPVERPGQLDCQPVEGDELGEPVAERPLDAAGCLGRSRGSLGRHRATAVPAPPGARRACAMAGPVSAAIAATTFRSVDRNAAGVVDAAPRTPNVRPSARSGATTNDR